MKRNLNKSLAVKFGIVLLTVACLFIIHSCKKNPLSPNELTADNASVEIKTWLSAQKADSVTLSDLNKHALWQTAHTVQTDSLTYLVVKLSITQQKFDDPNKKVDRYLVMVKNNDIIKEGYLFDIFGDATQISQNTDQYITNYNKTFNTPFTGNLSKLSLQANL